MERITMNGKDYTVIRLLGKGKGGYSYLVTDGSAEYVLKQIHHEPCDYYQFGDKLASELRDYDRLCKIGIPMPKLLEVDETEERILKEAKEEASQIRKRAFEEAKLEQSRVQDEIKQQMVTVAAAMAAKVVSSKIDTTVQDELVDETLREMDGSTWQD